MRIRRQTLQAALAAATATGLCVALATGSAAAGECPAGKEKAGAVTSGPTEPVGVTDVVLGDVDLSKEVVKLKGRDLRIRRLVIEPGGVVPWHSHAERPALIMTMWGTIVEYRSNCEEPITHRAGDVAEEHGGIAHWWKNESDSIVILIAADIKPPA